MLRESASTFKYNVIARRGYRSFIQGAKRPMLGKFCGPPSENIVKVIAENFWPPPGLPLKIFYNGQSQTFLIKINF